MFFLGRASPFVRTQKEDTKGDIFSYFPQMGGGEHSEDAEKL